MAISNKNIVITGAASGIGKELVLQLGGFNNRILAIDISEAALETLSKKHPDIDVLTLDLTTSESVSVIFNWINNNWKSVDLFFANAGFAKFGPWEITDTKTFGKMLQVNVLFPIETAKILHQTQAQHPCRLVLTASAMSFWPVPGYSGYAATKAALHQFVDTVRSEGNGEWITVVYPIAADTDFFKNAGKGVPKAFPIQSVNAVVKNIIRGVEKGKKRIFPSRLFQAVMLANRVLPIFKPIYFFLERKKLKRWPVDRSKT